MPPWITVGACNAVFVYKLTFANGKVYIGMSRTDGRGLFTTRYRGHGRSARIGSKNPVHCAWRKHGAPAQSILSTHATRDECAAAEVIAIKSHDALNPDRGYNLMAGGEGLNVVPGSQMYDLMRERVWSNIERRAKSSAALKGRAPSDATIAAYREWAATPEGKARKSEIAKVMWDKPGHRERQSEHTKRQMTPEARAHLSNVRKGHPDERSESGKMAARKKNAAFKTSDAGKAACRKGQAAMWANPETRAKWKEGTDKWRSSERNKEQCKAMAKLSAAACSKRVKDAESGIEYESQRAMARALGLSDASISLMVKAGKVVRL